MPGPRGHRPAAARVATASGCRRRPPAPTAPGDPAGAEPADQRVGESGSDASGSQRSTAAVRVAGPAVPALRRPERRARSRRPPPQPGSCTASRTVTAAGCPDRRCRRGLCRGGQHHRGTGRVLGDADSSARCSAQRAASSAATPSPGRPASGRPAAPYSAGVAGHTASRAPGGRDLAPLVLPQVVTRARRRARSRGARRAGAAGAEGLVQVRRRASAVPASAAATSASSPCQPVSMARRLEQARARPAAQPAEVSRSTPPRAPPVTPAGAGRAAGSAGDGSLGHALRRRSGAATRPGPATSPPRRPPRCSASPARRRGTGTVPSDVTERSDGLGQRTAHRVRRPATRRLGGWAAAASSTPARAYSSAGTTSIGMPGSLVGGAPTAGGVVHRPAPPARDEDRRRPHRPQPLSTTGGRPATRPLRARCDRPTGSPPTPRRVDVAVRAGLLAVAALMCSVPSPLGRVPGAAGRAVGLRRRGVGGGGPGPGGGRSTPPASAPSCRSPGLPRRSSGRRRAGTDAGVPVGHLVGGDRRCGGDGCGGHPVGADRVRLGAPRWAAAGAPPRWPAPGPPHR